MSARSGGGSVSVSRRLVPSRPVPHPVSSRSVPIRPVSLLLVSPRPTPSRPVQPHPISSHSALSRPAPSRSVPSHSSRPTPSHTVQPRPFQPVQTILSQPIASRPSSSSPSRPAGQTPPQRQDSPCCPGALQTQALCCRGATGGSARRDRRSVPPRVHPHPAARWGRRRVSAALRFGELSALRCGL